MNEASRYPGNKKTIVDLQLDGVLKLLALGRQHIV